MISGNRDFRIHICCFCFFSFKFFEPFSIFSVDCVAGELRVGRWSLAVGHKRYVHIYASGVRTSGVSSVPHVPAVGGILVAAV